MSAMKLIVVICSSHFPAPARSCLQDTNYTAFESLLLTDDNLLELEDAFFPTNSHSSVVIDVYYHLYFRPPKEVQPELKHVSHTKNGKEAATKRELINEELFVVHFKWLASSVNLFMRPNLLQRLSLMTYQVNSTAVDLNFDFPCRLKIPITQTCDNLPRLISELNDMTSNVSVASDSVA